MEKVFETTAIANVNFGIHLRLGFDRLNENVSQRKKSDAIKM